MFQESISAAGQLIENYDEIDDRDEILEEEKQILEFAEASDKTREDLSEQTI